LSTKILPTDRRVGAPDRRSSPRLADISSPNRPPPLAATVLHAVKTVAGRLACSERQVRRLMASGELPVHHIGRAVRISEDDLVRFLAARRRA
jgi:excisionase family DNA binding protein